MSSPKDPTPSLRIQIVQGERDDIITHCHISTEHTEFLCKSLEEQPYIIHQLSGSLQHYEIFRPYQYCSLDTIAFTNQTEHDQITQECRICGGLAANAHYTYKDAQHAAHTECVQEHTNALEQFKTQLKNKQSLLDMKVFTREI